MILNILQAAGLLRWGPFTRFTKRESWVGLCLPLIYPEHACLIWLVFGRSDQIPLAWETVQGTASQTIRPEGTTTKLKSMYSWVAKAGFSLQLLTLQASKG